MSKIGAAVASIGQLTEVHSSQKNPIGLIVQDGNGGEYIYMQGVASVVAGTWVSYDENYVTTRLTANAVGLVAIAMAAVDATTEFGWWCITSPSAGVSGACDTIAADAPVYIDGTAGRVDDASVAGDLVFGAMSRSADTSNVATFQISRPFVLDGAYLT